MVLCDETVDTLSPSKSDEKYRNSSCSALNMDAIKSGLSLSVSASDSLSINHCTYWIYI